MLSHAYSLNECKSQARFCLRWGLASSLGALLGIAGGLAAAPMIATGALVLLWLVPPLQPYGVAVLVAAVGVTVGAVVGIGQSAVLAWPTAARRQWIVRSVFGWGLGAGLGALAVLFYEVHVRGGNPALPRGSDPLMMIVMTPILGLVVGLALRPALPSPAPNPVYWLIVNAFAASFGRIAAWWLTGSSAFFGLTWTGLALGPLVYAAVTGTMMLVLEHPRRSQTNHAT